MLLEILVLIVGTQNSVFTARKVLNIIIHVHVHVHASIVD